MNKKLLLWSMAVALAGFLFDLSETVIAALSSKNRGKLALPFLPGFGTINSYLSNHLMQAKWRS